MEFKPAAIIGARVDDEAELVVFSRCGRKKSRPDGCAVGTVAAGNAVFDDRSCRDIKGDVLLRCGFFIPFLPVLHVREVILVFFLFRSD